MCTKLNKYTKSWSQKQHAADICTKYCSVVFIRSLAYCRLFFARICILTNFFHIALFTDCFDFLCLCFLTTVIIWIMVRICCWILWLNLHTDPTHAASRASLHYCSFYSNINMFKTPLQQIWQLCIPPVNVWYARNVQSLPRSCFRDTPKRLRLVRQR